MLGQPQEKRIDLVSFSNAVATPLRWRPCRATSASGSRPAGLFLPSLNVTTQGLALTLKRESTSSKQFSTLQRRVLMTEERGGKLSPFRVANVVAPPIVPAQRVGSAVHVPPTSDALSQKQMYYTTWGF